ncbi:GPP34 family phosphoprotein [Pelagicoccus sp. NFK12]|uniref:GPP34 family phosphoprotein n=1 Tax=Pelagicoccus enzymogenes TaxID=2773457 RepID=A0A927F8N8_9BACT|nr:GPP34 family phosphoprotein [Pelagicoccus enzymogenes]MBD5780369.1 GPP34 family phosphoprotein [Pelagicoccus enzymogenes]MDQ8197728.1 GPP34 family phosphoprotein [Pelagicoccus enzymogenes]
MLHLYQEITLLALRDDKGTVAIDHLAQVLAGALAAELVLKNKISLSNDKKKFVDLQDASPTGDLLLDECLDKLSNAKRRAKLETWVSRFASIKRIHHKAAQSLCQLGILRQDTGKLLLIFNRTIYPEVDPKPESQIVERLEQAIFSSKTDLSPQDTLLVSLANASGLLSRIFGRKRIKPERKRIKQIVEGEAVGKATQQVIEAIQIAIIVTAVIVPVIASS